uniref:Uncharacterized protein n=1 Tax=Salix viminalis TaxID=40686 RepID=A0A6N2K2W6_SALVM
MEEVAVLLLVALSIAIRIDAEESSGVCDFKPSLKPRPHSVSILEFGAVGDGKTLNTLAFQNAIFYLKSFTDKGGAQLYVPPGKWLTGSFSLTSHLTLFLEKRCCHSWISELVICKADLEFESKRAPLIKDPSHWDLVYPLSSYGRGIELPGKRYQSLINGDMLYNVAVTGDNGTTDGQGYVWWDWFESDSLNYSRPHLVEFTSSALIMPTTDALIRRVYLQSSSGSSVACGREMSNVQVEQVHIYSSYSAACGSEMSNVQVEQVHIYSSYSGTEFRTALPDLDQITLQSVIGSNITMAGSFTGLAESPFTSLCLFNVSLTIHATLSSWTCSNVVGFSESVSPEPCPELESSSTFEYSSFKSVKRDCSTAYGSIMPHVLFRRRVRDGTVAVDGLPASLSMRRHVVFLLVRHVLASNGRGRGGGRLKPLQPFLSLMHVKVQASPPD